MLKMCCPRINAHTSRTTISATISTITHHGIGHAFRTTTLCGVGVTTVYPGHAFAAIFDRATSLGAAVNPALAG
jgi:hypothetical protein